MQRKQFTLSEIAEIFRNYNRRNGIKYGDSKETVEIKAVIVYKQSNFTKEYSEESRSYEIRNTSGKYFFVDMMGNSIYGDCLDGSEKGVRLDAYDWEIEKIYFNECQLCQYYDPDWIPGVTEECNLDWAYQGDTGYCGETCQSGKYRMPTRDIFGDPIS